MVKRKSAKPSGHKELADYLLGKINDRSAKIGIIGMGYVGLPLAIEFAKAGYPVVGFDIDQKKIDCINSGKAYIKHIPSEKMKILAGNKKCSATTNFSKISDVDCIIICVPTPLTQHREPDMKYIEITVEVIAKYLQRGQMVVLESTTYPGTTREVVQPPLEASGLKAGKDFFLAYSPEREDPGNKSFSTGNIPKVVGGLSANCRKIACEMYNSVVSGTTPVSSPDTAEATKLLENIFRSVNIALVNEMKVVFDRMGIDVWEVIKAASTKPFGYMPFYPGPGLGGHCIPIDPFYLTWKAREFDCATRFIELAGEINTSMPEYVIHKLSEALNGAKKSLNGSKVLLLGIAYKKDVDDDRESPSLRLIELMKNVGVNVDYHDPHVPMLKKSRKYNYALKSIKLTPENVRKYDAVLIATAHTDVDYKMLGANASIIIDTRDAMRAQGRTKAKVVMA